MSNPRPFTQTDIKNAFKAARAAGYNLARVEIILRNGNKMVATAGNDATTEDDEQLPKNAWDKVTR